MIVIQEKIKAGIFLVLSVALMLFTISSCTPAQKQDEGSGNAKDTTAIGRQLAEISKKISDDPDNPALFHERAKLHLQRMDVANAMLDMEQVMKRDTTTPGFFLTLADVHMAATKPAKSKAALEKCLSLDPTNKLAYEKLAELYFIAQQYKDAIRNLDEVLRLDITNPKAYFMKGMCYRDMADTAKAISSFQTCVEQKPDHYDAFLQLAMIYHVKNDRLAQQYYDAALRVNPKSVDALYGRGLWYQDQIHDYDKAIQDYTSALQINPNEARAHFALGFIHFQYLKVYDQAILHYSDAIKAEPQWPEAWFNRGLAYESSGNIAAAAADYKKAIQLRSGYTNAIEALQRISLPVR